MKLKAASVLLVAAATFIVVAQSKKSFQSQIPNGDRVPNPCQEGSIWAGVGHQSALGANTRNPFGMDFKAAGLKWTVDLCRKDSDGDGLTNGQELGDPDCVWTVGATPARTTGLSHPGVCPFDSTRCKNAWTVCPKAFSCPALDQPGVIVRKFTIKETAVPPKETTYMCQAFELNNTALPVHMIGSRPIIINKDVMHHMIIYACRTEPDPALFNNPQECFMSRRGCDEVLNLWAYGLEGECFNKEAGFRIGGEGYRYAMLELHWNNPSRTPGFKDSSGFSLFFTEKLRRYDQGTLMYGEVNLVIPPRQPLVSVNHTCPEVCTKRYHSETRYITSAGIHMHNYGIKGRISLWRNNSLVKDLSPLQVYDYNSPQMIMFDPPVEYLPGDEVKTECYYNSMKSNYSVFFGEATSDEMCFSFLTVYPIKYNISAEERLSQCVALSGVNLCRESIQTAHVEQGCKIEEMKSTSILENILTQMNMSKCFSRTGCDRLCREYLENKLWPNNTCFDPKRARQIAVFFAMDAQNELIDSPGKEIIRQILFGQSFCEQEINMLAELNRKPRPNNTCHCSDNRLALLIVSSCLGLVIILLVVVIIASKMRARKQGFGTSSAEASDKINEKQVAKD